MGRLSSYSLGYKRELALKALSNPNKTVDMVAKESGVSRSSLFRWVKMFGPVVAGVEKNRVRPCQWSMAEKLRALIETQNMPEQELGEYLRRQGLYYTDLVSWRSEILDEVKKSRRSNVIHNTEADQLRRIRELERELKLKDKALREATALIALKKKAELLWGVKEGEKSQEPTGKKPKSLSRRHKKKGPG